MGDALTAELGSGKAFVELSRWRKVDVSGRDALRWLDTVLSRQLGDLGPGRARRALLLRANGAILADVTVAVAGSSVLVLQDAAQPQPAAELLQARAGTAEVRVRDRSGELALFAIPGRTATPDSPGAAGVSPSCLGPGVDLICLAADRDMLHRALSQRHRLADDAELADWRLRTGRVLGVDVAVGDLPQDVGWADLVDGRTSP